MSKILFEFMGADWGIEYYSSPEEFYIESITVFDSEELIDIFTETFIEKINAALGEFLQKEAIRSAGEDAAQTAAEQDI